MIGLVRCCAIVLVGLLQVAPGYTSNILFYHHFVTSSHRTAIWPLAEKLADKGHNVTYIYPVTRSKKIGYHEKIQEISPSKMIPLLEQSASDFDINIRIEDRYAEWMAGFLPASLELCKAFYDSPEIIDWLATPNLHYDLILIDGSLGECAYGLVHKFKAKMILFNALNPPFLVDGLGVVPESSSIPDIFTHQKPNELTLISRTISTLIPLIWRYKFLQYLDQLETIVWQKLNVTTELDPSAPKFTEIEGNVSLVLLNGYIVEDYPMALPPMFVSYSGLWCTKEKLNQIKPVPETIASFLEGSEGFFYVSLGSAVVASAMPVELRQHFFQAFRSLPNYKFLWRWTGPVPADTPENALLLPWFPQHDLMAHPKLKGFVSQVGRPSTQEAICHGVPIIAIPIFADQDYNAERLEYLETAINLDIAYMTASSLSNAFQEILSNRKWKINMEKMSSMFRDRPLDPLDNVLFWTEFVMRHDSTSLLKPLGMKQTWYQRRLLDVFGFLILIAIISIVIIIVVIGFIYKFARKFIQAFLTEKVKLD